MHILILGGTQFLGRHLVAVPREHLVDRNTVSNMTTADPDPGDPGQYAAIEVVDGSDGNQITNNVLLDNLPPNIAIGLPLSGSTVTSDANTVSGNTSRRSASGMVICSATE